MTTDDTSAAGADDVAPAPAEKPAQRPGTAVDADGKVAPPLSGDHLPDHLR